MIAVSLLGGLGAATVRAASDAEAAFIRPTKTAGAAPVWGVRGGIAVGLWPTGGPRGLLRVYAPYLGQPPGRVFNFIAVEPVVGGQRDLSELQRSSIDQKPGKFIWTADAVDVAHPPALADIPAAGVVTRDGGAQVLTVWLIVERFDNGAEPILQMTLRSDRPHELRLATFSALGGARMSSCVLTATMGNFARLRHLRLKDRTIEAAELFKRKPINDWGFFDWAQWPAALLTSATGQVSVSATADLDLQPEPGDVPAGWRYVGRPAIQRWSTAAGTDVVARVNGRATFWQTHVAIPGGPAFENFELKAPFHTGAQFLYGIEVDPAH
jgi:hypothetical protein